MTIVGVSHARRMRTLTPSCKQFSSPIVLDVPMIIWGSRLGLAVKRKCTRDAPPVIREWWGALLAVKRLARCHRNMHLVNGDAMALMLALAKGRSSSQMAPVCRAACAYVLASSSLSCLRDHGSSFCSCLSRNIDTCTDTSIKDHIPWRARVSGPRHARPFKRP